MDYPENTALDFGRIQRSLQRNQIDGWLLYDFRGSNSIAWSIARLPAHTHCTRRWALWIPANGSPVKIVHEIERHTLRHIEARELVYSSGQQWRDRLAECISNCSVAAEYSPFGELPTVSHVDAGTMELLRSIAREVVSSANVIQELEAVWSPDALIRNVEYTGPKLREIMRMTMEFIAELVDDRGHVMEDEVQEQVLRLMHSANLVTDQRPIVATALNAANPHYCPEPGAAAAIRMNECVLLDMWARYDAEGSTFSDITCMCYTGARVPDSLAEPFAVIAGARDEALNIVRSRFESNTPVHGFEVDRAARSFVTERGYGNAFVHRTGHSIGTQVHGPGANMDSYETTDQRRLIPGTSFSIEPGIYLPGQFGMRTEVSVVIDHSGSVLLPSGPGQSSIIALYR